MRKETLIKIIAELSRILLGVTFIFSGTVKAIDPEGTIIKMGDYFTAFGWGHAIWSDALLSFAMIAFEFMLGVCVLLGVHRRLSTLGILIFMAIMTPVTLYLALYNPVPDCGCFGDALIITNWQTFYKNIILSAAAIIAFIYCRRLTPCYSNRAHSIVALFAFAFGVAFCYWNYSHLPMVDFRPYKVGANIPKLMEIPADAPQDEYVFIYQKDGVQKEFKLEEAPAGDSTWVYVDARLVKQGFVPTVSNFELYNEMGDNLAEELFAEEKPVLLLISPHLEQASEAHVAEIEAVSDYAHTHNLPIYTVTASNESQCREWAKHTGLDIPFLTADDVLLKTIIRSNPGLVLMKQGTILDKWHHNDIPTPNELQALIEANRPNLRSAGRIWLYTVLAFVLPLLLFWGCDRALKPKKLGQVKNEQI